MVKTERYRVCSVFFIMSHEIVNAIKRVKNSKNYAEIKVVDAFLSKKDICVFYLNTHECKK